MFHLILFSYMLIELNLICKSKPPYSRFSAHLGNVNYVQEYNKVAYKRTVNHT